MTQQEFIDQNVRMLIGDLQLQLVIARGRIAELEAMLPNPEPPAAPMPNGHDKTEERLQ